MTNFALPELTRSMRAFASPAALSRDDVHDRFFGPFLDARRIAAATERWGARLTAFDSERLEATTRALLATFAEERFSSSAPDRRALQAQLEDACGELFDALAALGAAAERVRGATDDEGRAAAWPAWVHALHHVFGAADRGYDAARGVLDAVPPPPERGRSRARRARK